jgi:hypothetical protein
LKPKSYILRHFYIKILFFLGFLVFFGTLGYAQINYTQSNLVKQKYAVAPTIQLIQNYNIVPNSVLVLGIKANDYQLNLSNNTLSFKIMPNLDSIWVQFRIFPFNLGRIASKISYGDSIVNNYSFTPTEETSTNFFDFGKINYTGTIGRGLSIGNAQSAVLNSNLNLNIDGYLADSVAIHAIINDNNIPIQPEGTTQQLNEFDRILLQLSKKNWQLQAGDVDLIEREAHYLSFYKRVQGVMGSFTQQINNKISTQFTASGALTRGRYHRYALAPQEGNQGPYRLQGANNEVFFLVLANTERIFINGELLLRGFDNDYIIDYNTAEITFTNKRLITKDLRIQIEFEYADRTYTNSLFFVKNNWQFGSKLKLGLQYYTNGDAKNSPINQTLNQDQKQFLNTVGDSIRNAIYPRANIEAFNVGKILYEKLDTTVGLFHDSVFVFSTNPAKAKYALQFIDVGQGNGNYLPLLNGTNGKAYYWVAPNSGEKMGRYEPALFLITPKRLQIATAQLNYTPNPKSHWKIEASSSKNDINLFSTKDKKNDQGFGIKADIAQLIPIKWKKYDILALAGFEKVDKNFVTTERLRNIEFFRDWNLPFLVTPENELWKSIGFQLIDSSKNEFKLVQQQYKRGTNYTGNRLNTSHLWRKKQWFTQHFTQLLQATGYGEKGRFNKAFAQANYTTGKNAFYEVYAKYLLEDAQFRYQISDTFTNTSFKFSEKTIGFKSNPNLLNKYSWEYMRRRDEYPFGKNMELGDASHNITAQWDRFKNENSQWTLRATYRYLQVFKNSRIASFNAGNSLVSRAQYNFKTNNQWLTGATYYEIGSGQEQRRDFTFIEVPLGQGTHYWIDYNNNGIRELNEFELAIFPDQRQFIKLFIATLDYVRASNNGLGYQLQFSGNQLKGKNDKKHFLNRWQYSTSYEIQKKQIINTGKLNFDPFLKGTADTSLIQYSRRHNGLLSFNNYNPKWGWQLGYTTQKFNQLLAYGPEITNQNQYFAKIRAKIGEKWLYNGQISQRQNELLTPAFSNRNYDLNGWQSTQTISFMPSYLYKIILGAETGNKKNRVGTEIVKQLGAFLEARFSLKNGGYVNSKLQYNNLNYTGQLNTTISFVMLDALQPGNNLVWNVEYNKRLKNNLELQISYNGRKAGSTKLINQANMGITAAF